MCIVNNVNKIDQLRSQSHNELMTNDQTIREAMLTKMLQQQGCCFENWRAVILFYLNLPDNVSL